MITVKYPKARRFAEAILDIVRTRQFELSPGNVVKVPGPLLPAITLLSEHAAAVEWKLPPCVDSVEWAVSMDAGRITIRNCERWADLFTALQHKPVRLTRAVSLLFTGRIVPDVDEHDGFVRLTWPDVVRTEIPGLPTSLEPRVQHVDLYRHKAEIVIAGAPDVTVEF